MEKENHLKLPWITKLTGYNNGLDVKDLYPYFKTAESTILEVEGMPLHYRVTGKGPNLVLIHGVTSSLHTWSGWHEALSNDFRVISFDVPSFGMTGPHPKNDYSVAMYMRVIDQLLDSLGVEETYMAGNSFGGYLTWNYALHQPQRLKKIILLDAAGIGTHVADVKDFAFKLFLNPLTKAFAHRFAPRKLIKDGLKRNYGDASKITEEVVDIYHQMLLRKGNREGFSEVLGKTILDGNDNTIKIKEIKIPTLIMWGEKDRTIPLKDAKTFHELIHDSKLIVYKGVGHIPMEEIPQESAKDAKLFFLRIDK